MECGTERPSRTSSSPRLRFIINSASSTSTATSSGSPKYGHLWFGDSAENSHETSTPLADRPADVNSVYPRITRRSYRAPVLPAGRHPEVQQAEPVGYGRRAGGDRKSVV